MVFNISSGVNSYGMSWLSSNVLGRMSSSLLCIDLIVMCLMIGSLCLVVIWWMYCGVIVVLLMIIFVVFVVV